MRTDGRTDVMKPNITARNFSNAPKNLNIKTYQTGGLTSFYVGVTSLISREGHVLRMCWEQDNRTLGRVAK
jgi:hypothetical protein